MFSSAAAANRPSHLVPASLLIDRYFAAERGAMVALDVRLAELEQQLAEMHEEHGGTGAGSTWPNT